MLFPGELSLIFLFFNLLAPKRWICWLSWFTFTSASGILHSISSPHAETSSSDSPAVNLDSSIACFRSLMAMTILVIEAFCLLETSSSSFASIASVFFKVKPNARSHSFSISSVVGLPGSCSNLNLCCSPIGGAKCREFASPSIHDKSDCFYHLLFLWPQSKSCLMHSTVLTQKKPTSQHHVTNPISEGFWLLSPLFAHWQLIYSHLSDSVI